MMAVPTHSRHQITKVLQERLQLLPGPVFAARAIYFFACKVRPQFLALALSVCLEYWNSF